MNYTKNYCKCSICKKEIVSATSNFNNHIGTHYNPISRNCTAWYKSHFKKDQGVCVCVHCDDEFHHDNKYGLGASEPYEQHLKEKHSITR
ncbi:hypothetical protein ACSLPC_27630 [Escherichia coli]|uniref:hypothetical protein n=1 Tax=Escherichia coli TaxID=562 RepID=UPI003EE30373